MILPKESATFSSCRFNFFRTILIPNSRYNKVLAKVASVKKSLWLGTADIKDLHVKVGNASAPFLSVLNQLVRRGIEVRLIHAKEPGPIFREEFNRFPMLRSSMEMMLCPRVHFKILVFDGQCTYVGSANLTGAGIGMKSANRRNFEAGILTDSPQLLQAAIEQFDSVWRGEHCKQCGRKKFCKNPIK